MLINLDPVKQSNLLGEALRTEFFNQSSGRLGCYSTFDYNKDVVPLPDYVDSEDWDEDDNPVKYHRAEKMVNGVKIEMQYRWSNDGYLMFSTDEFCIINDDCKKIYNWETNI